MSVEMPFPWNGLKLYSEYYKDFVLLERWGWIMFLTGVCSTKHPNPKRSQIASVPPGKARRTPLASP